MDDLLFFQESLQADMEGYVATLLPKCLVLSGKHELGQHSNLLSQITWASMIPDPSSWPKSWLPFAWRTIYMYLEFRSADIITDSRIENAF